LFLLSSFISLVS